MLLKNITLCFCSPLLLVSMRAFADDSFDLGPMPELPTSSYLLSAEPATPPAPAPAGSPRVRSYELPPVNVVGQKPSDLREEDRVGSDGQPRWTGTRRVPEHRGGRRSRGKKRGGVV